MTGLSRLLSVIWLVMRLRFRFSLERSLSNTSPERRAETRSSNSPPSSLFSLAFLILRSLSRCSLSCKQKASSYFVFCLQWWWILWNTAILQPHPAMVIYSCQPPSESQEKGSLGLCSLWKQKSVEKSDHYFVIRISLSRI